MVKSAPTCSRAPRTLVRKTPHPIKFGKIDALASPSAQLDPRVQPLHGFARMPGADEKLSD